MDEITQQAMANIKVVLQSFLPAPSSDIEQSLVLLPSRVKPTGLGGYVGVNVGPDASLFGRLIEADIEVMVVSSDGPGLLSQAVSDCTQAMLSQTRTTLRGNGVFSIELDHLTDIARSGTGNNTVDIRTLVFKIVFEFIPIPAVDEGNIETIVQNSELGHAEGKAAFFNLNFAGVNAAGDDPLSHFDFFDDPDVVSASPVGQWEFDPQMGYLEQINNVRGGASSATNPKKAGAQALVLQDGSPYLSKNLIVKAELESADVDGIGFVFRWLDDNNFYLFVMSARNDYNLLAKKVAGNYEFLQSGGLNEATGYSINEKIVARLSIENQNFSVYLNDKFVVSGEDNSISEPGRVGFLTHRNSAARFYNIELIDFTV
ncbi:MAG: hypothetical protein KUG79_13845 [Pseudomonadales bacterium]|nr:hypothetical protein [Pseudomonadales bacterium]